MFGSNPTIIAVAGLVVSQVCMTAGAIGQTAQERLWPIALPNGQHIRVLVGRPDNNPVRAALLLFAGGDGRLKLDRSGRINRLRNNFLVRTRQAFWRAGYATVLVDAPSDRRKKPGLLAGYRASKRHAARDIAAVLSAVKTRFGVPVFLVGTSRGTVSVANAARRLGHKFAGVALTASITAPNKKGASLRSVMLDQIRTPTLFVHHTSDQCVVTPLHGARQSFERMQRARVKVRWATVSGGRPGNKPCKGKSHHGFWGSEGEAVGHIQTWIKKVLQAQ